MSGRDVRGRLGNAQCGRRERARQTCWQHQEMGRTTGSEPATSGTTNRRSNQLSYDRHAPFRWPNKATPSQVQASSEAGFPAEFRGCPKNGTYHDFLVDNGTIKEQYGKSKRRYLVHILGFLSFLGIFAFAGYVIQDALEGYGLQIATALNGRDVVPFRAAMRLKRSLPDRAANAPGRNLFMSQISEPLPLAA
jgi:hypothetical protein